MVWAARFDDWTTVMGAGGGSADARRWFCRYTGESYQYVVSLGDGVDAVNPVPRVVGDQAVLEAEVFEKVAHGCDVTAHPLGISRVRTLPGGAPIVFLDGGRRDEYPRGLDVVERILPFTGCDGEFLDGVAGLRVIAVRGVDLVVGLAGTAARLVLRGDADTRWSSHLAARESELISMGYRGGWTKLGLSGDEFRYRKESLRNRSSWLGSGILRRVAMVRTAGTGYANDVWRQGERWIIEMDTWSDVLVDHNVFLQWVSDPVWGLDLGLLNGRCGCADAGTYFRECRFELKHVDGRAGILQLRFRSWSDDRGSAASRRKELGLVGADQGWLNRVLPIQGRST